MTVQISAKTKKLESLEEIRINQCDIFHDIDVIEYIEELKDGIRVNYIHFPLVMCLNQDCDLNSDSRDKNKEGSNKNCRLLNLIVTPLFNIDSFSQGTHWGDLFQNCAPINLKKTQGAVIMNNDDPRYHFLHFEEGFRLPDLIIDFKHIYSVSTQYLYDHISNRLCSVSELYREKVSQRFAYYFSRIGLPD